MTRSYGQKFRDSGCISRCLSGATRKLFFVKVLLANKDSASTLWKIVAEFRADIMWLLDFCTKIWHASGEVMKLGCKGNKCVPI